MTDSVLAPAAEALERGDLEAARALLEERLQAGPDYDALCLAGVVCYRLDETHAAKTHLICAAELDPARPEAYVHLGELFAADGAFERAEGYYHQAWQCAPESEAALNELALFYQDQGLPYSAKRALQQSLRINPEQEQVGAVLDELERLFPDRMVSVYVPAYNAAQYIEPVLEGLLQQSYPIHEVLVIDDGSSDDTVERASRYPVRIITHGDNRTLAMARNTALLVANTEFLANLDSDVVPDTHWLERCMLHFESERFAIEDGESVEAPLGGVMGRLDELHDVWLEDQWRSVHMGQHHGDQAKDEVPHLYGCNSVFRREALLRAGGYEQCYGNNGEDCEMSDRVREAGYRLMYDPAAKCRHLRRDDLTSLLNTAWRYHVPYLQHRFRVFDSGKPMDVLGKMNENLVRYQNDLTMDQERRAFHLAYLTFLGLPWRVLSDFKLAARLHADDDATRAKLQETHTAIYLAMFSLLADTAGHDDLLKMVHEDLAPCLPEDEALAAKCAWPEIESIIAAGRGERVENPLRKLIQRDVEAVDRVLNSLGAAWYNTDEMLWSMIRSSALRLRHEREYRGSIQPGGARVAILNCPWTDGDRIGVRAGSRWPFTQNAHGQRVPAYVPFPFFLATAAAMLKDDGFESLLVDAIAEGLRAEEFVRRLDGFQPDVIVMETATGSHEIDLDWALQFKERYEGVKVILVGPHATALGEKLMVEAPYADGLLLGEFEPTLLDLMAALRDGGDIDAIPGLLWRRDDGSVMVRKDRRKLPKIDSFPWPDRMMLPMYNYFDSFAGAMPWPNVQMHASRGCPFQCIFCVWPQVVYNGQNYRTRDNADIVAEMEWLIETFGFRAIYFDDDTFNIKDHRIIDLCDRIAASEVVNVPITAMGRADTSSYEAYQAMKRAGLVGIKFGVETGDQDMMHRIEKHLDLEKVTQAVEWCKELEIGVHLTFSFGGPGETHETAEKTIKLALELDPDTVQFSLMTPFPGTTMYRDAIANGNLLTTDWKQFDGARYSIVKGEFLSRDELEGIILDAHRRWLLRLTEREVNNQLRGGTRTDAYRAVAADELADLAGGEWELLQLTTPIDTVADPAAALATLAAGLKPGGALVAARRDADHLAQGWCDDDIVRWAQAAGLKVICSLGGFNGEVSVALQKPAPRATLGSLSSSLRAAMAAGD